MPEPLPSARIRNPWQRWFARRGAPLLLALILVGCAGSASPSTTSIAPSASPSPTATSLATPTLEASPTEAGPTPVPGSEDLRVELCPLPRSTAPACLDGASNGESPAFTSAIKVGQTASIVVTVKNIGATAVPALTLLLFTFEPPMFESFLEPVSCNGCRIQVNAGLWSGAEWDNLAPGDHELKVTVKAVSRPTDGRDANGAYQWLCAMYAEPYARAGTGPIDTSAAFALATAATVISQ